MAPAIIGHTMYEPVELKDLLIAVVAGALVVVFGALYAFTFAVAKLKKNGLLMGLAYGIFAGFSASVLVLAWALNLVGYWWVVTIVMLLGYLLAPQAIWKLSVGTHEASDHE
jgi:hypothetical protein